MNAALRLSAAGVFAPLLLLAGCGMIAAPQPPSLKLPEAVTNLSAKRVGKDVVLRWTMPRRSTDKLALKGPQRVEVCRQLERAACTVAGNVMLAPGAEGEYADHLPAGLIAGAPRALSYTVLLENRAGRSAGPSNIALAAAGEAPEEIGVLHAQAMPDGVALIWTAQGENDTIRIHRALVEDRAAKKPQLPSEQTLEFSGKEQGWVLDPDAALDHTYTYTVQRIVSASIAGRTIELESAPSPPVTVNARDVFPPAVPLGLEAVADAQARAIDLSWQPDTEADLAGYAVYRHERGSNALARRMLTTVQPSFRDTELVAGRTYDYSVSAVDRDGNESARSPEVEETLPQE